MYEMFVAPMIPMSIVFVGIETRRSVGHGPLRVSQRLREALVWVSFSVSFQVKHQNRGTSTSLRSFLRSLKRFP